MDHKIFWNIGDWSSAVAEMPAPGPLPCRTVLVSRESVAHALRRELIRGGRISVLAGARYPRMAFVAGEVLRSAGAEFGIVEEAIRRVRLEPFASRHEPISMERRV